MTSSNAPSDLDLSACTVSSDGGSTSETLGALASSVSQASTDASTAKTTAATANTTANGAQTTANAAQTAVDNLGSTYIKSSLIGQPGGVPGIDSGGGFLVPLTTDSRGYVTYPAGAQNCVLWMASTKYTAAGASAAQYVQNQNAGLTFIGGSRTVNSTATATAYLQVGADVLEPIASITTDLGQSGSPWANVYSATSVVVTSDAREKTVVGEAADTSYDEGKKLGDALFAVSPSFYRLKKAEAEKGDSARIHSGFIAQNIEKAITDAGLDPAHYALWAKSLHYKDVDEPVLDENGQPVKDKDGQPITARTKAPLLDENGEQVFGQSLRYEELLCTLYGAARNRIIAQDKLIADLTARVVALENKS